GDDVLGNTVGKEFLLGVARHVSERQYRDRRLVGERQRGRQTLTRLATLGILSRNAGEGGPRRASDGVGEDSADAVNTDRPGDVFQRLIAQVFEGEVEPAGGVLLHP